MIHAKGKISFLIKNLTNNVFVLEARNLVGKRIRFAGDKVVTITYVNTRKGFWLGESK